MIEYKKIIKKAPLPFLGNKRNAIKGLYEYFKDIELQDDVIIIDLFGGSGLLANLFKQMYPNNRVIYNDFDFYIERLSKFDDTKNFLMDITKKLNKIKLLQAKNKLTKEQSDLLIEEYQKIDKSKIDIITVNNAFSFRGALTCDISKRANHFVQKVLPLKETKNYLKGVEIIHKDFKEILNDIKELNLKVLIIADPPYISTLQKKYGGTAHFLENLKVLKDLGPNFVYFSSYASGTHDIIKYINGTNATIFNNRIDDIFNIPKIDYKHFFEFHSSVNRTEFCLINVDEIKRG